MGENVDQSALVTAAPCPDCGGRMAIVGARKGGKMIHVMLCPACDDVRGAMECAEERLDAMEEDDAPITLYRPRISWKGRLKSKLRGFVARRGRGDASP